MITTAALMTAIRHFTMVLWLDLFYTLHHKARIPSSYFPPIFGKYQSGLFVFFFASSDLLLRTKPSTLKLLVGFCWISKVSVRCKMNHALKETWKPSLHKATQKVFCRTTFCLSIKETVKIKKQCLKTNSGFADNICWLFNEWIDHCGLPSLLKYRSNLYKRPGCLLSF